MSDAKRGGESLDARLAAVAAEMDDHERMLFGFFGEPFGGSPPENTADDRAPWRLLEADTQDLGTLAAKPTGKERAAHAADIRPLKQRIMRWGGALMALAMAGSLVGVVGANMSDHRPAIYKQVAPAILEAALASDAALIATGTCADELLAQAEIDEAFLAQQSNAVGKEYWDRPALYRAAAARAIAQHISCSQPADNPRAIYELPAGPGHGAATIGSYNLVVVELGNQASWCITRAFVHPASGSHDPGQVYEQLELAVGDRVAAEHGITCG